MLDQTEDELAMLNNEDDLITSASLVSVDDLRKQWKKLKVCIPAEADKFMLMLKRYANLVYAIFGDMTNVQSIKRDDLCVDGYL